MEVYRYEAEDGLEHLIKVFAEDDEGDLSCETVHRLGSLEYRIGQSLNKCLFEELVGLGLIIPDGT
jgi:hypothetical protein